MPRPSFYIGPGFREAELYLKRASESLGSKFLKTTLRRNSAAIVAAMKSGSPSVKLMSVIGATTSQRLAGAGVRLGVIKNNPSLFPDFSAQATASVIEYGTAERYRQLKSGGLITGRVSTGRISPKPFLRPAWVSGKGIMISKTVSAIKKKIPS